ncbi:cyclodeaminase/cyclohydrolase family protein [Streptomyces sp. NPDC088732]|uniref:cyclodeaminase/cyclohydrolase family protein n=1 Tax=Streptomyces sp. NPDC088732 TaxID=3365879 RepID=UPI00382AC1D3
MRDQTIGEFLEELSARVPAPGGGASAALHAAQGASLVAMVARYTTGERYAAHAAAVGRIAAAADELRETALRLGAEDATAFTAVTDAYRLPKGTDEEKTARSAAVAAALEGAARPPAEVVGVAERVVALAEELLPICNRNVLSDVAAATEAARAAAGTARVNIEINLGGIKDGTVRAGFSATAGAAGPLMDRADRVTAAVRREIAR